MRFIIISLLGVLTATIQAARIPNVPATFGSSPRPFKLNVNKVFIEDLRQRVKSARAPLPLKDLTPPDSEGPSFQEYNEYKDFWVNKYDWARTEASINQRLKQFTTTVKSTRSNYTHPVPLHFVHHKSPRADAQPLLFIHGWPGSFLEVENIIERLTNPPNNSVPAFHVVAPSIPGFGFSPAPEYQGYGPAEAAHSFHSLMMQLNYTKYVINGGDFGGITLRLQTFFYPKNVRSALSNFWYVPPSSADLRRYEKNQTTPDESLYISTMNNYNLVISGYRFVQQTQPLALAYSVTDSPLGFAMWIYALMRSGIDPADFAWTPQTVITFALMYLIQGPYAGLRFYKEATREGVFEGFGFGPLPYIKQPVAIDLFPYDINSGLPLDWARREGNVQARYVHDRGGHFAAYEVPDLVANDIWTWFGGLKLNSTA